MQHPLLVSWLPSISHLLAISLLLFSLTACKDEDEPEPTVRPVLYQQAHQQPYQRTANYSGDIEPRYETALGFQIKGKIIKRYIEVGDRIGASTLLAQIDPEDYQLSLQDAQAGLRAAQAEKNKAGADLKRYKQLLKNKVISEVEFTNFANRYDIAQARLDQAKAQLAMMKNQAGYTSLIADQEGVITDIQAEVGQVVMAGQTVLRMALSDEKEVVFAIPENQLQHIKTATDIKVSLWASPDKYYRGRVREVSPNADPVTRTYQVRVAIDDTDNAMVLGMTAKVEVIQQLSGKVVSLPLSAIYHQDEQAAVWQINPDTLQVNLIPVEIVEYRNDSALISKGLANGQLIVTAGVNKLYEGQVVRLYDNKAKPQVKHTQ